MDAGNLLLSSAHYKALSLFNCPSFRLPPYALCLMPYAGKLLLSSAHYKALSLFNCPSFRLPPYA